MLILKSRQFNDEELISYGASLSSRDGGLRDKLLHWDFGPVMEMKFEEEAQNYLFSLERVPLHWDGAFYREPRFLLFYCTESQGKGGETLFLNTESLWESLTEDEKRDCSQITLTYRTQKLAHYGGEIRVPLVQKHPETGRTIMRIAERVETRLNPVELEISGIPEGEEFYQHLIQKIYQGTHLKEHRWSKGDVLICDNHTYLHGRNALGSNLKRSFKRIQIL